MKKCEAVILGKWFQYRPPFTVSDPEDSISYKYDAQNGRLLCVPSASYKSIGNGILIPEDEMCMVSECEMDICYETLLLSFSRFDLTLRTEILLEHIIMI
jgi:hypothetical protein